MAADYERDEMWRVTAPHFCAAFFADRAGRVTECAPILHRHAREAGFRLNLLLARAAELGWDVSPVSATTPLPVKDP